MSWGTVVANHSNPYSGVVKQTRSRPKGSSAPNPAKKIRQQQKMRISAMGKINQRKGVGGANRNTPHNAKPKVPKRPKPRGPSRR